MALVMTKGFIKASIRLFEIVMGRVVRSPMSFFDRNPIGRILNRFSKDIEVVDTVVPYSLAWCEDLFFAVFTPIFII